MAEAEELNDAQKRFATYFYEEVNNVIGGTNPNEKLSLLLPGITLLQSDYSYDFKNNAPKGPVIEANESRLANKLYDPFDMVISDNGKTLEHQYKSALDALTPKLNPILAKAKNQLRELLLKNYPYKFEGDEPGKKYTFQEVFFRLYDKYIEKLTAWSRDCQNERDSITNRIKNEAGLTLAEKNQKIENEYLIWYENNANARLTEINEKMSAVLSVFSENDMKIIEGILDSGSGAELQEARQTMNNFRKLSPNGGYIYPVKFNPTNWFEYLDTSFTPVDLLSSPATLLDELELYYARRSSLLAKIEAIGKTIPTSEALAEAEKNAATAKEALSEADVELQNSMEDGFSDFAKFVAKAVCAACVPTDAATTAAGAAQDAQSSSSNDANAKKILEKALVDTADKGKEDTQKEVENAKKAEKAAKTEDEKATAQANVAKAEKKLEGHDPDKVKEKLNQQKSGPNIGETVSEGIDCIFNASKEVNSKQSDYLDAMDNYLSALSTQAKLKKLAQQQTLIDALEAQSDEIDRKIKILNTKLNLAGSMEGTTISTTPPTVPDGFTQLTIIHNLSKHKEEQTESHTFTKQDSTKGFWIFKKKERKTTQTSSFESLCEDENTEIRIGMNIAKVTIEREWFNPGVFALTGEMYNVAERTSTNGGKEKVLRISHGPESTPSEMSGDIFPCYPTAFVIARDVTVKVTRMGSSEHTNTSSESSEVSKSRGFFVFNAGDGSKSSTENSSTSVTSDDSSITMKFAAPQIIGICQHYLPKDESAEYPPNESGYNTIIAFVNAYKDLIDRKTKEEQA